MPTREDRAYDDAIHDAAVALVVEVLTHDPDHAADILLELFADHVNAAADAYVAELEAAAIRDA